MPFPLSQFLTLYLSENIGVCLSACPPSVSLLKLWIYHGPGCKETALISSPVLHVHAFHHHNGLSHGDLRNVRTCCSLRSKWNRPHCWTKSPKVQHSFQLSFTRLETAMFLYQDVTPPMMLVQSEPWLLSVGISLMPDARPVHYWYALRSRKKLPYTTTHLLWCNWENSIWGQQTFQPDLNLNHNIALRNTYRCMIPKTGHFILHRIGSECSTFETHFEIIFRK